MNRTSISIAAKRLDCDNTETYTTKYKVIKCDKKCQKKQCWWSPYKMLDKMY